MKMPRSSVAVPRGRLTRSVTPSAVPTVIIGARRTHSSRNALLGFSKPMRSAQDRSARTKSASANLSGTRCVASGMVTSAAPKPVTPKISAPMNALPASSAISCTDYQIAWRAAVHRAQARHVARERQAEARLEPLGAPAQRGPLDARRRPLQREHQEVRVVERRQRQHGAAESALQALQRPVELRVVVHEVDHHHARLREREESAVVELGAGELRHVLLVLEGIDDQRVAAFRRERRGAVADLDRQAAVVRRQPEVRARGRDDARVELDHAQPRGAQPTMKELGQRPAAQADHERPPRLRMKEEKSHHAARVVEREGVGLGDAHRALDRFAADVQHPHAALVADGDRHPVFFHTWNPRSIQIAGEKNALPACFGGSISCAMALYMVKYDLKRPLQNYPKLYPAIKACGMAWHAMASMWFVMSSEMSAYKIADRVRLSIN